MQINEAERTAFQPGQVFRSFVWPGPLFGELSSTAEAPGAKTMRRKPHTPVEIQIDSLEGAVRAEIAVEFWGGHTGTSEQSFQVNNGPWIALPQPEGTPGPPECYMRTVLGNPAVEVPLETLQEGTNQVRFHAGPQICHSFRWGFFWIYAFTIRVFYESVPEAPALAVEPPDEAGKGVERAAISVEGAEASRRVDVIARYRGFDWKGNGRFYDWHYFLRYGKMCGQAATGHAPANRVFEWDMSMIPDQEHPIELMAIIEREDGTSVVSRATELELRRAGRKVVLIEPDKVPEAFAVRVGQGKTCLFRDVKDHGLVSATLLLSTWSAAHGDEIGINGRKIVDRVGVVHDVSHDRIGVPPGLLSPGTNSFYIFSRTEEHAAEVNWPGPGLLLEYRIE